MHAIEATQRSLSMLWKFSAVPLLALLCFVGPVPVASAVDRDHDGLPDRWEREYHLSTTSRSSGADRDRDGLSNFREYRLRTNPRRADTDRDSLRDGAEVKRYKTNPRKKDTDGDGYSDGAEVKAGSNPRSKRSIPRRADGTVLPPDVTPAGAVAGATAAPGAAAPGAAPGAAAAPGATPGASGPPPVAGAPAAPTPLTCNRTATTSTLGSQLSAATAGQTICLASGNYGTFSGARKSGMVTIGEQPGASATMNVAFSNAQNITLDGVAIGEASLTGSTRDITIRNATFSGPTTVDGVANANILFDRNSYLNIDAGGQFDSPARIHLPYTSSTPSGVTVQNSLLSGGDSDGIQAGTGLNIINNEFRDLLEKGSNHTDAIQLLSAPGSVIRGNYIHHTATGIVAYDGVSRAVIEDNVIDLTQAGAQRPWGIELYSDSSSSIRHNTVRYGASCSFDQPCGMIALDRKPDDPAGAGTVVVDNIATEIAIQNGSVAATRSHNLLRRNVKTGDKTGTPIFSGAGSLTSYAAFTLTAASPGRSGASDGTDIGIVP
jgi:hypothetical protein